MPTVTPVNRTVRTFCRVLWLYAIPLISELGAQSVVATTPFAPGGQQLVLLDFSTFPLGHVVPPRGGGCLTAIPVCDIRGELEIVMQDGKPMLRASGRSSFVVRLPQRLPTDFTLEFDLIPKTCCQPEDLSFEGVADIAYGQTAVSANVLWHHNSHAIVGGVKDQGFSKPMPEKIRAAVMGSLANIAVSFRGTSLTMYTNDEEIYSVQRAFVRGSVLRVFLGGQNDTDRAVYLAKLRIAGGPSAVASGPSALSPSANPLPDVGRGTTSPPTAQGTAAATASPTGAPNPAGATGPGTTLNPGVTRGTATPTTNTGPAPTGLTVTGTPTSAVVQWLPVPGAVDYVVNRQLKGATVWTRVTPSPITTTASPVDQPLQWEKGYTYQVVAYQADRTFGVAEIVYQPGRPENPTGLRVSGANQNSVQISWDMVPGAWEYIVSGPSIAPGGSIAATSAWLTPPTNGGVYKVVAVYEPGGVLTPESSWPSLTVRPINPTGPLPKGLPAGNTGSTPSPSGSGVDACGCQRTGGFVRPTLHTIDAGALTTGFTHPTHGRFRVNAQSATHSVTLHVTNAQARVALSYPLPAAWGHSKDYGYFAVAGKPQSTNGPAPISVYRVTAGTWPKILDTSAYPDGRWGFSAGGKMFIVTRTQSFPNQFSFLAYNLESVSPERALQQGGGTNLYGADVLTSPCDDRLMFFSWSRREPLEGEAIFYRRTSFGQGGEAVRAPSHGNSTPSASIVKDANKYLVQLSGLTVDGKTTVPSLQCSP